MRALLARRRRGRRASCRRARAARRRRARGECRRPRSRRSASAADVFEVALGRRPAAPTKPAVEIDGDAVSFDATGIDQVVFRLAPNPGEPPGRWPDRLGRRAVSRVALAIKEVLAAADADADARLRRDRHRHRRPERRSRRAEPVGARRASTRCCASPTCPRSRPTPTPTSRSRSANATAGRSPRSSGSTARAGSSSSPQMLGGAERRRARGRAPAPTELAGPAPRRGGAESDAGG